MTLLMRGTDLHRSVIFSIWNVLWIHLHLCFLNC